MTCFQFELLGRIPFANMRLRLCRRHIDRCPRCRQMNEASEAPPPLITAAGLPPGLDLWPGIRDVITGASAPERGRESILPRRRLTRLWAYAAVMLALLLAGFWIILGGKRGSLPPPAPSANRPLLQTRLSSAKVADRPARVFQVQSQNPDRSIFWIARDNSRS